MKSINDKTKSERTENLYSLRNFTALNMAFLLIVLILTALVVVPKINNVLETQNANEIQVDLALQAELFTKYVESQSTILQDLAQFPVLISAAMLSDPGNPKLEDLIDNIVIGGESARLILQNYAGEVVTNTTQKLQGNYSSGEIWVDQILDGSIPYHFQLLSQENGQFTFKISVPVEYNTLIEGVLSAEISVPLDQVFITQSFNDHIAFKLVQDSITIATAGDHIGTAQENSVYLEQPDLTFIYITDNVLVTEKQLALRNTVLIVLLVGLGISLVLFVVFGYRSRQKVDNVEKQKFAISQPYSIPVAVAVIGIAISTIAFSILYSVQKSSIEQGKVASGKTYVNNVQETINRNLRALTSLAAFYNASNAVDRQEFDEFNESFTSGNSSAQVLAWIPKVTSDNRISQEELAKADGLSFFEFKELSAGLSLREASERDRYFPVYFISPTQGNENILGYDFASNQELLEALENASRSGNMVATTPLKLVDGTDFQNGTVVLFPVYDGTETQNSVDRDVFDAVRGFVLLMLKTDDILNSSFESDDNILSTFVRDVTDSEEGEILYGNSISPDKLTYSYSFDVAGRTWQIDTLSTAEGLYMRWVPWLVLVTGLVISAFITAGLAHLIRQREVVESLVARRTAKLRMLSSIAANSNDIFIVTDAEELRSEKGGPRVLYVNEAFTRYTGYTPDEIVGKTPRILQGSKTDPKELDLMRDALSKGKPYQGELVNYTKDNEEYWTDINIIPLKDEDGKNIQYAAVQRIITDRIAAQSERESLIAKLSDSNEELARFAFVCSHDLQEPLRMIRSFSEKLQAHIADDLVNDEKGQKYFRFITEGAARAQDLICDILAYSSIESDTQQLQLLDSNQLIDNIRSSMQVSLQNCGGQITCDPLPELQGNKTQLYQLFQNLINNAIKYQSAESAPIVHISVCDAGNLWQFSIKDNGIGMEERHLNKIFDVFQRLHRKSQFAGTGVGLSICKKVVERHGGSIWVESEYGAGSNFIFTLLKPTPMETIDEPQRKAS